MAPRPRAACQICNSTPSKYTCPVCAVLYCSVACFKQHKDSSCTSGSGLALSPATVESVATAEAAQTQIYGHPQDTPFMSQGAPRNLDKTPSASRPHPDESNLVDLSPPPPLRPLTTLKWPYIPEEPSYPDPLKRDDPKPLTIAQYEAISTSPAIRTALASHARLPDLLRSIDQLKGSEREEELQRVLGVRLPDGHSDKGWQPGNSRNRGGDRYGSRIDFDDDDMAALKAFAGAVEKAVRGERNDLLGLEWETE